MRPAKPIKIAPSNADNVTKCDLGHSAYSSNEDIILDGHTDGENRFIIGNNRCDDLNSGVGGMTIGSLPSVRRGRRSVVTSGENERLYGSIGNRWTQNQRQYNDPPKREMLATSMPVPHAPFLSSRRDYETGNNISSIPSINLTRSAAESIESDSVPYGSLRESTFTRMNTNAFNRTACLSDSTCNESSVDDKSSDGFIPLYLPPTHLSNDIDVKNNVIGTENRGGIASLLDGGDSTPIQMGNDLVTTNEDFPRMGGRSNIDIGILSSHDCQVENKEGNRDRVTHDSIECRLGTSLTGLDILRSSQSGLVDLTREQKESLQNRVKDMGSYIPPVSRSLSSAYADISTQNLLTHHHARTISSNETQSPQPSFLIPRTIMRQSNEIEDPESYDDRLPPYISSQTSFLIPPGNMIQDHETEDSDSYDNEDIFDMDE